MGIDKYNINLLLAYREALRNKVTVIDENSNHIQYPTAKAVWDLLQGYEPGGGISEEEDPIFTEWLNTFWDLVILEANTVADTYTAVNHKEVEITGTLPNGVTSTLSFPSYETGKVTSGMIHFYTGSTLPTLAYTGGTVKWKDNYAIGLVANCKYSIYWERRAYSSSLYLSWGNWYV